MRRSISLPKPRDRRSFSPSQAHSSTMVAAANESNEFALASLAHGGNMRKVLLTTIAVIGLVGAASAADLRGPPRPAPIGPVVPIVPVFSWTGCYIGGFVGGAWSSNDVRTTDVGTAAFAGRPPYNDAVSHSWNNQPNSSVTGGGQLGCNWQPIGSPFVFGIEGEIGGLRLNGSAYDPITPSQPLGLPLAGTARDTLSNTRIGNVYGMVTGRVGYSFDRVLLYAKGGVAFLPTEFSVVDSCLAFPCGPWTVNTGTVRNNDPRWTVGAGAEWAFARNWSVKAEYMFIGIDRTQTALATAVQTTPAATVPGFRWDNHIDGVHTAKVGLNYRFDWPVPLVARY
jgi:outer membrane immunogenic protein